MVFVTRGENSRAVEMSSLFMYDYFRSLENIAVFFVHERRKKDPKMASSFRTQKQHGRGDDAHWVVTLSGLISGPYYGRCFFRLGSRDSIVFSSGM